MAKGRYCFAHNEGVGQVRYWGRCVCGVDVCLGRAGIVLGEVFVGRLDCRAGMTIQRFWGVVSVTLNDMCSVCLGKL